jgi:hypothetical protein
MKTLMRTLTLSAAALAALVAAPKSDAQQFRHDGARETFRGNFGHGGSFRGGDFRGREFRGHEFREHEFRGGEFRGREWRGDFRGRAFFPRPAFFGRRHFAPFRVFAGSRFYSYCPGPGYIYVDDLGWVFPPFVGAVWVPAHINGFGVRVGGFWR